MWNFPFKMFLKYIRYWNKVNSRTLNSSVRRQLARQWFILDYFVYLMISVERPNPIEFNDGFEEYCRDEM